MKTKIYYLICCMALSGLTISSFAQKKTIMYVGREAMGVPWADYTYKHDSTFRVRLESTYDIVYCMNEDIANITALEWVGVDAVYISESVDSKSMGPYKTTHEYCKPFVCCELFALMSTNDRWSWMTNDSQLAQMSDGLEANTKFVVSDNTHYITSGYNNGEEVAWSSETNADNLLADVTPAGVDLATDIPTAIPLANSANSGLNGKPMLWAIPAGFTPPNHTSAIDVRAVLFGILVPETYEAPFTEDFYTIAERSIAWVLGDDASVNDNNRLINSVKLYPNPVCDESTLSFIIDKPGYVSLSIMNMLGQQSDVISEEYRTAGRNTIKIDASELNSGVYFYVLKLDDSLYTGKMNITK